MKRQLWLILSLFIFLCLGSALLMAQNKRTPEWLKKHDRGNRSEGPYNKDIGNPFFELVSFCGFYEGFSAGEGQQLKVKFYVPATTTYRLHAEELDPHGSWYWMQAEGSQAEKGWREFAPWPVDDWLRRMQVPANNLGVLIELEGAGSGKVMPAFVYHSEISTNTHRYVANIRLGKSTSRGSYEIFREGEADRPLQTGRIGVKYGGSHFPIVLSTDSLEKKSGWYRMNISLTEKGTIRNRTFSFSFYHRED